MSDNPKIRAGDVIKALSARHKEDMFFTEVKNGATQTVAHHCKMDALAIKISWTNFKIVGYEVKVSRSDFLRDDKWRSYLPMCNELYFAVAPGIVDVSEIPEQCGLVQLTAKGGLRTIRKAVWRDIAPPVEMYKYLMFGYIGAHRFFEYDLHRHERVAPLACADIWQDYLSDKATLKDIGYKVSEKISKEIREAARKSKGYDELLESNREYSEIIRKVQLALGLSCSWYGVEVKIMDEIAQLKKGAGLTKSQIATLKSAEIYLRDILKEVDGDNEK